MNESPNDQVSRYAADDEISLVDLAKILILRWKLMAVVFCLVVATGTGYAWITLQESPPEPRNAYTTLLSVGYKTPKVFIEPLGAVATQLEDAFIPAARRKLESELPVQVKYEERRSINEDGSNVIRLVTTLPADAPREPVAALHESALASVMLRHDQIYAALLQQSASGVGVKQENDGWLFVPSEVTSLAQVTLVRESADSNSTTLIIILSVLLGGVLALMAAFFAQFFAAVRKSFNEDGCDDGNT